MRAQSHCRLVEQMSMHIKDTLEVSPIYGDRVRRTTVAVLPADGGGAPLNRCPFTPPISSTVDRILLLPRRPLRGTWNFQRVHQTVARDPWLTLLADDEYAPPIWLARAAIPA
jgi:hypothetical protein